MHSYFRALAVDYDNTLTVTAQPGADVLSAIREVRSEGQRVVLVTGRIIAELRDDFPDVDREFDLIVAENGAVLVRGGVSQLLVPPVDPALEAALVARGVPVRRGEVILATETKYDTAIIEEVAASGLETQIMFNRGALMLLPHDVTKGSGLTHALTALNLSPRNTVAIGDAENDHSLLDGCEIGVAVSNAVKSLKSQADIVLEGAPGTCVAQFLRGPFRSGLADVRSKRWQATLGTYPGGETVRVPGSRTNIGIFGGSGHGKSYLAGLLAERLIDQGYAVCVLDLEGDHVGLATLHGALAFGGHHPAPAPEQLGILFTEGLRSAVVDLSMHGLEAKRSYAVAALEACRRSRDLTGAPHWVIVEEAQVPLATNARICRDLAEGALGLCLVSYQPELICPEIGAAIGISIHCDRNGTASIARRGDPPRTFTPGTRLTPHDRHWHKYTSGELPAYRRFEFRDFHGPTGESAGNIDDFRAAIVHARPGVLRHHAAHGDFSRWLGDLSHDARFVETIRAVEDALRHGVNGADVEPYRRALVGALMSCYGPG